MELFQRGYTGVQAVARRGRTHTVAEDTTEMFLNLFAVSGHEAGDSTTDRGRRLLPDLVSPVRYLFSNGWCGGVQERMQYTADLPR